MPKPLTMDEIRRRFVAFFVKRGHKHVPADSLVPANDPSVLFTGAGMNQFKDHFAGIAKLDHPQQRAVTVQPCVRASDIGNVGRTPNHHACFEMLGNFSFGDYFKDEAVQWAVEFATDPENGLGMDPRRISVTVYAGDAKLGVPKDEEAIAAWKKHAPWLKDERAKGGWRIYEYGEHENFWPAGAPSEGPNGPCGPCSELFYDTHPAWHEDPSKVPAPVPVEDDKLRYAEFWNLVFTQYNRRDIGKLDPLPSRNIDTGSGLERVARLVQGKPNNFENDLLFPIVETVAKIAGKPYGADFEDSRRMRRITDHVRFAVWAIHDGVAPKNEGRNYVVRRLMRRAILDGQELGIQDPFLARVAEKVFVQLREGYPHLEKRKEQILRIMEEEERTFNQTLAVGRQHLGAQIDNKIIEYLYHNPGCKAAVLLKATTSWMKEFGIEPKQMPNGELAWKTVGAGDFKKMNISEVKGVKEEIELKQESLKNCGETIVFSGRVAFMFWDTYGFPLELTQEECGRYGLVVDQQDYEKAFEEARRRSQDGSAMSKEIFKSGPLAEIQRRFAGKPTDFKGYAALKHEGAKVLALVQNGAEVQEAQPGEATVLLDATPFYAESGGQVGDRGWLSAGDAKHPVTDTQKQEGLFFHAVELRGPLKAGDAVTAEVDPAHRRPTLKNHSATHLLHLALRETLGTHVEQRGSLVEPQRLRFDFTHFESIGADDLRKIEERVNALVQEDHEVRTEVKSLADAKQAGAMALFGEKYGDKVRVVAMGPSMELCGGTHVARTGQIGYFRIAAESSISAGVRRIEALTGLNAVYDARAGDATLAAIASSLKTGREDIVARLQALQDENAGLERELKALKQKSAASAAGDMVSQAKDVAGTKLLAAQVPDGDAQSLRATLDGIRRTFKEGAVVLGGAKEGKVALLVSLSPELVKRGGHAGNILKELAPKVGGKGGGKPDMAQGGGRDADKLPEALASAESLLAGMLK
ncbi:MAG: alanine--tRNA ligase [Planctomycetes bacterium]|nr:alanine--tRNA ligase [Planctomycetota bacterium]